MSVVSPTDWRHDFGIGSRRPPVLFTSSDELTPATPQAHLLRRAFELRANVSAYDACYVALAERLDCELITADGRLAAAPGPRCAIRVLR